MTSLIVWNHFAVFQSYSSKFAKFGGFFELLSDFFMCLKINFSKYILKTSAKYITIYLVEIKENSSGIFYNLKVDFNSYRIHIDYFVKY